jgi:putative peptide zinc metalloprotease protein
MTPHRRLCALLVALAVAFAPATPALAQGDNTAVAVNTKDGSSVFKLAFSIKKTLQPVVENGNAAVAYASCEDCQTVAIAIQVVLVMGDADVVSPENLALAINDNCTACETLASAYQFVLGTGGVVRLTKEGRKRIQAIRKALRELRHGGLSILEIQARVDELYGEVKEVFRTELEYVGPDEIRGEEESGGDDGQPSGSAPADTQATPGASGAPGAADGGTATPEATSTPSPTATPTATPSATPTETPTATPTAEATP